MPPKVAAYLRTLIENYFTDLGFETLAESVVRIERQYPVVANGQIVQCPVPLGRAIDEWMSDNSIGVLPADLDGLVRAAAVNDENFVGKIRDAFQTISDVSLFIEGQDDRCNWAALAGAHRSGRLYVRAARVGRLKTGPRQRSSDLFREG